MPAVKDTANNRISMNGSGTESVPYSILSVVSDINDANWINHSNGVVTLYRNLDFFRGFLQIPDNVTVVETANGHLTNTNNTNPNAGNGIELVGAAKIINSGATGAGFGYGVQGGYGTYKTTPLNGIYPAYSQQSGQRYDTFLSALDAGFNVFKLLRSDGLIPAGGSVSDPFGNTLTMENSGLYIGQLIWRNSSGTILWGSGANYPQSGNYALMQGAGNIVVYTSSNAVSYATPAYVGGAYLASSNTGGLATVTAINNIYTIVNPLYAFSSVPNGVGDYNGIVFGVDGLNIQLRNEGHFKWYSPTGYIKNIDLQRSKSSYTGATPTALQLHWGVTLTDPRTSEFAVSGDWPEPASASKLIRPTFDISSAQPLKGYLWPGTNIDIIDPKYAAGGSWNGLISPDGIGGTPPGYSTIGARIRHRVTYNATAAKGATPAVGLKLRIAPTKTGSHALSESILTQYLLTGLDGKIAEQTLLYKEFFPTTTTENQASNTTTVWRITARNPLYICNFELQASAGATSLVFDPIAVADNTSTTLTPAQVASSTAPYSGISFNRGQKLVTVTLAITAQRGYDSGLWWLFQDAQMDLADFNSYAGAVWDVTDWAINGLELLAGSIRSTGVLTANAAMSNLSVIGNVNQATPTNLNNVVITRNLTYNTNSNITVRLTNCRITGTISNSGTGTVTVIRVGTTTIGTVGARITSVVSSVLTLATSAGDVVGVYDASGNLVNQSTATGAYTLDVSGRTGIHKWVVERYGSVRQSGIFNPANGDASPNLIYIPDSKITQTNVAIVAEYTEIDNPNRAYDYEAYARTLDPQYSLAVMEGAFVSYGNTNLVYNRTASAVRSYNASTNTLTLKATNYVADTYLGFTTTGTVTTTNGATLSCVYTSNVGRSTAITINLNQSGARLLLRDSGGAEKYNAVIAGNTISLYFAPVTTGTWNGTVALYGFTFQTFNLTVTGGGAFSTSVVLVPDTSVVAPLATVQNYTSVSTTQQLKDWMNYYSQTSVGIGNPVDALLTLSAINIGAITLAKGGSLGYNNGVITTGAANFSGGNIITSSIQSVSNLPNLSYPNQLIDATGQTNWLKVILATGQKFYSDYDNLERTNSFELLLPSSFSGDIKRAIYRRGYKTEIQTIPYSTAALPIQSAVLTQDVNIIDTTSDLISSGVSNAQQAYDCIGQYLTTKEGCFETYSAIKAFGSVDFGSKNIVLGSSFNYSASEIRFQSSGLIGDDMYLSLGTINIGSASLSDAVKLRFANIDSELTMSGISTLLMFPSLVDALALQNQGRTLVNVNTFRYLYGSVDTGVTLSNQIYAWVTSGSTTYQVTIPIRKGASNFAKDTAAQLVELQGTLNSVQQTLQGSNINAVSPNFNVSYSAAIGASSPLDAYSWAVITKNANGTLANVQATVNAVLINSTGDTPIAMTSMYDVTTNETTFKLPVELDLVAGDILRMNFKATIQNEEVTSPDFVSTVQLTDSSLTVANIVAGIEGSNVIAKKSQLQIINDGVKAASGFEPHNTDIP